jgi:hypothetical protein
MAEKRTLKKLEPCKPGDLICVEWLDASTGKSSNCGGVVDIPVWSWGVYIGLFGTRRKHIILAQNSFQYSDGLYDVDYTAIPVGWALGVTVIAKAHFPEESAAQLVNSFLRKDKRIFSHTSRPRSCFQQRLSMHGRPD